ncbi:MAG: hypothetical protein R3B13_29840 [Polyangiaceae bacterium]
MKERDFELMAHHDGELSEEERQALLATLTDEDEGVLEGLEQLGETLRLHADQRAAAADDIADAIMAQLDAEQPSQSARRAGLRVIHGGASDASPEEKPAMPAPRPEPTMARQQRPGRAGRVFLTLSLAAAAALAVRAVTTEYPRAHEAPVVASFVAPLPVPEQVEPVEAADVEEPAAAIETIDFGSQNGAIFMVSAGAGATPVVWLTDDPQSGDRMEPL